MPVRDDAGLVARLFPLTVVAALAPLVVATARAVQRGWIPVGDNAFFAIRARDVLSAHPPLLGTWTSNSLASGVDANNPGPLYFDLLGLPARVAPGGAGLAVGAALLNGLAVVGTILLARRRAGPLVGMLAAAVTAALCWAMGSELLFDPWQPHAMLLPFLAFLALVWSMTDGDLWTLPAAVAVGSLLVQTHLGYVILVPVLGGFGVVALAVSVRRRRNDDAVGWAELRRRTAWAGATAIGVAVACWAQSLIEQFTSEGDGNLTRLVRTAGRSGDETLGYGRALRLLASVVVLPPWWVRPSFGRAWLPSPDAVVVPPDAAVLPALGLAIAAAAGLAAGLAWLSTIARRRRDRVAGGALATALVASAAAVVTAGQAPLGLFGLAPHQFRWLWPLGAFTTLAVSAALLRRRGGVGRFHRTVVGALTAAVVVLSALNLPTYNQQVGPSADEFAIPVLDDLGHQMSALEGRGPLLMDLSDEKFASPYGTPIMAELQRRGIPFVVEDRIAARQLGPSRRFDGTNAAATLRYRVGDSALRTVPGTRRIALHQALDRRRRRQLAALRLRLATYLEDEGVVLNQRGREALAAGDLPDAARPAEDGRIKGESPLASKVLVYLVQRDLLALDTTWAPVFRRYADLQDRHDTETVALFLGPPP